MVPCRSSTRAPRLDTGSADNAADTSFETTGVVFAEDAPVGSPLADQRLVFLGPDADGELLEVMAVRTDDDGLLVIHAQPMRARYLGLLTGGLT
jgi:hypothetical protein